MPGQPANGRIRTALVGAGGIARATHLPALAAHQVDVDLVAVVEPVTEVLEEVCRKWDVPGAYTDFDAMLAETRPDLVVICTPPSLHSTQAVAALRSGAWVWCEKPPARSLAEYDAITAAESAGGPYASIVFQQRFGSATEHLRRLIVDGALGDPLVALCQTTWYRDDGYFAAPWRGSYENEGGGPAMALGIHQIDLTLHLLGDWAEIRAMTATLARRIETDDVSVATVRFDNGALGTIVNSALSPREETYLRYDFSDATLELSHLYGYDNSNWRFTPGAAIADRAGELWPPKDDERSSHRAQLRGVLASIKAGERPVASGPDGRAALELISAMYKAAANGRPVRRGEIGPGDPFYTSLAGEGART